MAQPLTLEGTWEELSAYAEDLQGKRLKLIVMSDEPEAIDSGQTSKSLAQMLEGRIGVVSFEPGDLSRDTGRKFAELLAVKSKGTRR